MLDGGGETVCVSVNVVVKVKGVKNGTNTGSYSHFFFPLRTPRAEISCPVCSGLTSKKFCKKLPKTEKHLECWGFCLLLPLQCWRLNPEPGA